MLNQMNGVGDSNIPGIFVSKEAKLEEKWKIHGIQAVYLTSQPEILRRIKQLGGASIYLELTQKNKVPDEGKIDESKAGDARQNDTEWQQNGGQEDFKEIHCHCYEADYIWQMSDETDLPDDIYLNRVWQRHMHLPWLIAETERLIIRESVMEDLPYFQRFYEEERNNPDVQPLYESKHTQSRTGIRYSEQTVVQDKDIISHANQIQQEQFHSYITTRYPFFEYGLWTIVDKATNTVIGRAGIEELPEDYGELSGEPELSYLFGKEYRGNGYATEACLAILHYSAEELEMKKIYLRTSGENLPSQKLAEKLGLLKVESITEYKDLLYCGLLTFEG